MPHGLGISSIGLARWLDADSTPQVCVFVATLAITSQFTFQMAAMLYRYYFVTRSPRVGQYLGSRWAGMVLLFWTSFSAVLAATLFCGVFMSRSVSFGES